MKVIRWLLLHIPDVLSFSDQADKVQLPTGTSTESYPDTAASPLCGLLWETMAVGVLMHAALCQCVFCLYVTQIPEPVWVKQTTNASTSCPIMFTLGGRISQTVLWSRWLLKISKISTTRVVWWFRNIFTCFQSRLDRNVYQFYCISAHCCKFQYRF